MTRTTNARVAGCSFLVYIAAGLGSMALFARIAGGDDVAAKLASIARHPTEAGVVILLGMVMSFAALVLAVTLYAVTREQDKDLAMLGLVCRATEGVIVGLSVLTTTALRWLASATGGNAPDSAAARVLGAYLLRDDMALTATFFAVGSALFAWLLLRGRMIPVPLAWLGVIASALLVGALPLQQAGFLSGPVTALLWLPMLAFEVPLGLWLIVKGVAGPARPPPA